ncbi:MAG TPA: 5-deoxy-glucuronate isomerase [Steroidobacteraceae bacterium]|nr:5-deoxy-glucuronate isomerase [Steroidobacteraceae bacterium]
MSLLVKPDLAPGAAQVHRITPQTAGWEYVGFEVFDLRAGERLERSSPEREQCFVLLSGEAAVHVNDEDLGTIGPRPDPFDGRPYAVYLPPRARLAITARRDSEIAAGSAPAEGRHAPRLIRPTDLSGEVRGTGTNTRRVFNVLPESAPGERLLVVEVLTPGGHWSSYPPHKHDQARGAGTAHEETRLEETYYHRLSPAGGFAVQRVYTDDRSLDETLAVEDRDVVLVPRGYHPVSAPHGFELYYLNVMAGPVRRWRIATAPGYEFLTKAGS